MRRDAPWQASPKNKIAFAYDDAYSCLCSNTITGALAPESAVWVRYSPNGGASATYTAPITNRLLLEGVLYQRRIASTRLHPEFETRGLTSVNDQATGITYRALSGLATNNTSANYSYRATLSYVTGAHAWKTGLTNYQGSQASITNVLDSPLSYRFNNGVPNLITMFATPYNSDGTINQDVGLFLQDKWTHDRLTLTMGVRYDYFSSTYPEQQLGPGPLAPTRNITLAGTKGVMGWKDLSPRTGAAYDLFGNGKTAVKVSVARYVAGQTLGGTGATLVFGDNLSPVGRLINSTTRSWNDNTFPAGDPRRGNFVPDCDLLSSAANGECGAIANTNFGRTVPGGTYDPETLGGWAKRNYNWQFSAGVQQELLPRVALDVSYFRRWYGNFIVTDNRNVVASDYTAYSLTAPADARLPGGGGYTISGLYDLNPNKVGSVDNYLTFSDNYGKQIEHWDGIDFTINARPRGGVLLQGGLSTGRTTTDNCDVVAKLPEIATGATTLAVTASGVTPTEYCHLQSAFLTQVKLMGTYSLPKVDVLFSGSFQSLPGPQISANYVATNAAIAPSLGRNLSGNAANATVNVVTPGTMYGERLNQLDVRFGKLLRLGRTRATANVDLYNSLNANTILTESGQFATWRRPQSILQARFVKLRLQLDF